MMFNPHERFQPRFINAFLNAKKYYLVAQTFKRGADMFNDNKECILLTHYDDKGLAIIHKNALTNDRFAAIIDLQQTAHLTKLKTMLQPDSKYVVFSSLIGDPAAVETGMHRMLEQNMRRYIDTKTNWRIPANYTVHPKLELIFGELFVNLKFGSQSVRVKLDEIEKT
ncbi:hypothetical protein I5907_21315 [Panacibacter sp. DH6]|uniref:Uncharacterized protein n=1 Tax=Panacibacter microcysteis TaxID=2793269 RepID=A0A931MDP3_9BACT|nr:hypothetical protein [Panacibacter microcysteis]MBG9378786.1 hypothetical protein [Panacibacter microcysteis]